MRSSCCLTYICSICLQIPSRIDPINGNQAHYTLATINTLTRSCCLDTLIELSVVLYQYNNRQPQSPDLWFSVLYWQYDVHAHPGAILINACRNCIVYSAYLSFDLFARDLFHGALALTLRVIAYLSPPRNFYHSVTSPCHSISTHYIPPN